MLAHFNIQHCKNYSCSYHYGGGAWWAAVHGVAKSQTRLSNFTFTFTLLVIQIPSSYKDACHIGLGFPSGSDGKESACSVGDLGLIPELGRFPGEGNDYPLQFSCLKNSIDREAWWATVHGVAKRGTQLSN